MRDDLFVGEPSDTRKRDFSAIDLRSQIAQIRQLLTREARLAQRFFRRLEQLGGSRVAAAVNGEHAIEYRARGFAGQLLVDDRAKEGMEMSALRSRLEAARANTPDD